MAQSNANTNIPNHQHLKGSALEYTTYPRGEYFTRFNETSFFDMNDPLYWNSFYRSIGLGNRNRFAKITNELKINRVEKNSVESNPLLKMGILKSPFQLSTYQTLFNDNICIKNENGKNEFSNTNESNSRLYDELLEHKCGLCGIAMQEYREKMNNISKSNIRVYYQNYFPCIMVHVNAFDDRSSLTSMERINLHGLILGYFVGIINHETYLQKIPIEFVNRASFGHSIPSADWTGDSFRIQMGLVPEIYVRKVLVHSLIRFNEMIPKILNEKIGSNFDELERINDDIRLYNEMQSRCSNEQANAKQVELWSPDDSVFDILCKVGDSSGENVAYQIIKERRYNTILSNYVLDELIILGPEVCPAAPLKKLLMELKYDDEVSLKIVDVNLYRHKYMFPKIDFQHDVKVDATIQRDSSFWGMVGKVSQAIEMRSIYTLSDAVANKRIRGIYRLIEIANLELMMNSGDQMSQDGYGSDSDCEIDIPIDGGDGRRKVYRSKKMHTATGMRTLIASAFLLKYHSGIKKFNYLLSYFETPLVIESLLDTHLNFNIENESDQTVQFIDLNHCNATGDPNVEEVDLKRIKRDELNKLRGKKSEAIVLDYTATRTERIREAIELFLPYTRILLLVNSGMKHEQIGADTNTYGTIRIICNNDGQIDHLISIMKSILNELDEINETDERIELPRQAHNIRKCYKQIGASVTSEAIFDHKHWTYKKIEKCNCLRKIKGEI